MFAVCVNVVLRNGISAVSFEWQSVTSTTCRFPHVVFVCEPKTFIAIQTKGPDAGNN